GVGVRGCAEATELKVKHPNTPAVRQTLFPNFID
ncbi:MAG: hypothetical protein JWM10_3416, partial [Myxococcaceae bacterium]|nr:hypothetical protein [Myxococcaceae bacterium]